MAREFTIVKKAHHETFIEEVNNKIKEGWQFHGTTLTAGVEDALWFVQAFIREIPSGSGKSASDAASMFH